MNKLWASVLPLALLFLAAVHVIAQKTTPAPTPALQLFPLEDLKPEMKGTARTVFSGTETEEFGVEILGVLPGFPGPRQSAIIARLSGANVEKTGVFAGMSGSPVYIDGKIVGAIAYSFPFSREPIAGITPIKQMIDLFNKGTGKLKAKRTAGCLVCPTRRHRLETKPAEACGFCCVVARSGFGWFAFDAAHGTADDADRDATCVYGY